ncbi:MAG: cytochrome c oxidase subunit II [Bryobacterales bacterium]|nr:cytochrome c oxidase subunit II [Bryobacterales bacterium]
MLLGILIWAVAAITAALFLARSWFPAAISEHARAFDTQFHLTLAMTGAMFLLAQLLLGIAILRARRRTKAEYSEGNTRWEIAWTLATAALFLGAMAWSTPVFTAVHLGRPRPGALRVEALAKQFSWNFRYPGPDGRYARLDLKQINDAGGNPFGADERDSAGKDDIVTAALRIPAGRDVELILRGRDVIHNFFVRELRLKQDVVPGMLIPLRFRADVPGTYEVACSELCGLGHHLMRTVVIVMPPGEFAAWERDAQAQLRQE